ncbi:uncharacterized protein MONOS_4037 [Monocercomonoides exilis]|uniref:uncharacterized protein n=1 Tax=Monocercomonoides exilis TaxID=2049356 RepID=UPI00355A1BED|nr:hypothetical protein MONOS_4037 [Monocercomonoides exilis]|eukprot:MONOS_4037.1-p1 / transcript=MONOS_4037.1 / gene=MONOS_4037 / organism=Monocercomonoides_exilis_PA203 / gene_product=unspecified product / transcript_product=unspecified product / location=Mono_scaffold00102:60718-61578(+) / protein_length=287 / sequence_SO=supercontig / SO=protein_coding / is_pseudo=false
METQLQREEEMIHSSMEQVSLNHHSKIVVQQPQQKECGTMEKLIVMCTMDGFQSSTRTKSLPAMELILMLVADPNRPHAPPTSMPSTASFPSSKMPLSPSSPQYLFPLKHSLSAQLKQKSLEMAQIPQLSLHMAFLNLHHHLPLPLHLIHLPRLPSSNRPRAPSQSLPSPSPTTPQTLSPPSSSTSPITPLPSTSTQPPSPEQPHLHHQSQHPSSSSLLAHSPSTTQQSSVSPSTAKASSTSPPSLLPSPSTPPTSPTSPPQPPPPAVSSPLPPPLPSPSPSQTAP